MTAATASHGFVLYHHHRHLRGLSWPPSLSLPVLDLEPEVPRSYVHIFVACAESNVARLLGCDRQAMLLTMYTSRVTGETFGYGDLIGLFSSLQDVILYHPAEDRKGLVSTRSVPSYIARPNTMTVGYRRPALLRKSLGFTRPYSSGFHRLSATYSQKSVG
ncbi:hypothetical protein K466DRAFT_399950 [Polyporus arcularius HHB13444]|uniref:Uncharacterized protein n=1 Tax=Polyporus arcularius HHB13444 TaxID=1314778 RepID=A0A5C3NS28_9APHY|nr:hypothetical protein K466DRAFT_399950 [Polyporus arcularius HHB13444]